MTATSDKPHQCPDCAKRFRTHAGLRSHFYAAHTARERVQCPHCGRNISKVGLHSHIAAKHHPGQPKHATIYRRTSEDENNGETMTYYQHHARSI